MKKVLIAVVLLLTLFIPVNIIQASTCTISKLPTASQQISPATFKIQLSSLGNCSSFVYGVINKVQSASLVKKIVCIRNGKIVTCTPANPVTVPAPQPNTNPGSVVITPASNPMPAAPVQPAPAAPNQPVTPNPTPAPAPSPAPAYSPSQMQSEMLGYVNAERAKANLAPLTLNKALCDGAYLKSKDMADNNYFSHTSPTYGSPFDMMKSLGITYRAAAENIAKNISVSGAHTAFMNSPGHKANILGAQYSKVGFGFVQEGQYLYVTQWFTN
ncbi:MAG: CAP domain-containing protein [Syntrophomonadaceae bacterium]|nr:CAP domain-containing protein [Syntrophomonadaceae bacterium]